MTATLVCQIADRLGHAAWYWTGTYGNRHYTDYDATPASTFDTHQPASIPIRAEHDGPTIGEVVYLEHGVDGDDLTAVGVVDLDSALAAGLSGLYCSAEIDKRTRRGVAEPISCTLTALAVVAETASVAARPLRAYPGSVTSRYDRGQWPHNVPPVLGRAAAACEERSSNGGPLYIHRPWPAENRTAPLRPLRMGPVEHGPPGRILSVGGRPVEQRDVRPPGPVEIRDGYVTRVW